MASAAVGSGRDISAAAEMKIVLIRILHSINERAEPYFWKLIGSGADSLSSLLEIEYESLLLVFNSIRWYNSSKEQYCHDEIRDNGHLDDPCQLVTYCPGSAYNDIFKY